MHPFNFDLFVIGGGSAGVRTARMAAQRGARVGLAEVAAMGGTCVNLGCIPKKLYSFAAKFAQDFDDARGFGWQLSQPILDWELLQANRAKEIARLIGVYTKLLTDSGVQLFEGRATFTDGHTLTVSDRTVTAERIIIATGGRPVVPAMEGSALAITSDQIIDIKPFPKRLMIVGGGYIACEFASIFNGLGSQVTLMHRGDKLLAGFDDDVRRFVAAELSGAGINVQLGKQPDRIARRPGGLQAEFSGQKKSGSVQVDTVLLATGRSPNTEGLGLESAGVEVSANGAIPVDANYRTTAESIYALGDVTARIQLTPVALGEAMALVDHLLGSASGKPARSMTYDFIPTAVFTNPSVASVGYTEAQARVKFAEVQIYRSTFRPLKHTLSGHHTKPLMKLVVDAGTDRVVGLHMVGDDAGEIVQGFAVAMKAGATKAVFDSTVGIHPTAAEEFVTMREPIAVSLPLPLSPADTEIH